MRNFVRPQLITDNEFRRLFLDKSSEKIKKLKESILSNGCVNPLHVWDGILLDGYDRYEICVSNGIPFEVCEINFKSRNEAIEWICVNQLKRKDLTLKMQKYLMGKLYIVRKNIGIENGIPAKIIQKLFSEEFKRNSSTVDKYASFSRTIDKLSNSYAEYTKEILSEKISISYNNTYMLTAEAHKYGRKFSKSKTENKSVPAKIKIMPDYDPDADLAGLKLTIPSWIGSIERVKNSGNFEKATNNMKSQLKSALKELNGSIENILKLMEENYNE